MNPIFNILVGEALEALSLEELASYRTSLREVAAKVAAKDADTIGELSATDLLEQMRSGVEAIDAASARITELEVAAHEPTAEELESELEQLATRAAEPVVEPAVDPEPAVASTEDDPAPEDPAAETAPAVEPEPAPETEPEAAAVTDPDPEPAPEPAVAAAAPLPRPARSRAATPVENRDRRPALIASCEGIGYALGEEIPDEHALAAAMIDKRSRFGHMTAREDVPIATIDTADLYPEDRRLSPRDTIDSTMAKVNAVLASLAADPNRGTDKALIAAGGVCAPRTPLYDLQMISAADRPVRAALPAFLAERGGINFGAPPTLADVDTAVGVIEADEDALGGTSATKTCQTLVCPDFSEVDVGIIYHCVQTSNLTYRTYPEQLAQFNQLVLAAHARLAEGRLLENMRAASTLVTAATGGLGAVGDLLPQVLAAAAGMRSRHRMNDNAVLRVMFPRWSTALMVSDVIRSQFQRFDTDEARLTALLRTFNVEPSFYKDAATTDSDQIFAAQGAGALVAFPAHVDWFLFPEGTFLYLDGGTLELGLVRDSVLNSTNEFQIFGETFENVAKVGVESLHIRSAVCDSGIVAAPGNVDCGNWA